MKKEILNLGKALNKAKLKEINGGKKSCSNNQYYCGHGYCCNTIGLCQPESNTDYPCEVI
jgi:hypothetical protein